MKTHCQVGDFHCTLEIFPNARAYVIICGSKDLCLYYSLFIHISSFKLELTNGRVWLNLAELKMDLVKITSTIFIVIPFFRV